MKHLPIMLALAVASASCSSLPSDGPSARAINSDAATSQYALVDVDFSVTERLRLVPETVSSLKAFDSVVRPDTIGQNDVLSISIFDPGGTLFGGGGLGGAVQSGTQALPPITVDATGRVVVPYAGAVSVVGLTPQEAAESIRRALRGRLASPQVVVSLAEGLSNTVTVLGEVRDPGRYRIRPNADTILDVIGEADGTPRPNEDVLVTIVRDGQSVSAPLSVVTTQIGENIRLSANDQVNLRYQPRRFSTFGAVGAVAQVEMAAGETTLTLALSKVGGLDTNSANARSVLVFRFERPEVARALGINQPVSSRGVPVVYRIDLADPSGFFIADSFVVRPDDVIYAPRAGSAELRKFFEFVQSITRVVYDVTVTGALGTDN